MDDRDDGWQGGEARRRMTAVVGNYAAADIYNNMWNCENASKTELAYPGAISSSGSTFTDYWMASPL